MARLEKLLLHWFQMSDEVWERHANPLSVWTRLLAVPLLALSVWSRVWIDAWAWMPVLILLIWFWLNPRVFAKPNTLEHWASKSILGERLWLARDHQPIAKHHAAMIGVCNTLAALGALACSYGLYTLNIYHTIYGLILFLTGKAWFLDRMVWIYHEYHSRIN